jgi:PAS domain S-box-containing protein
VKSVHIFRSARGWYSASLGNRITAIAVMLSAITFTVMASLGLLYVKSTLDRETDVALRGELIVDKEVLEHTARAFVADLEALAHNTLLSNSLVDTAGREIYTRPAIEQNRLSSEFGACLSLLDHQGEFVLRAAGSRCAQGQASSAVQATMADEEPHWALSEDGAEVAIVFPISFPTTKTTEGFLEARVPLSNLLQWEATLARAPQYGCTLSPSGKAPLLTHGKTAADWHMATVPLEIRLAGPLPLQLSLTCSRGVTARRPGFIELAAQYVALTLCGLGMVVLLARRAGKALAEPLVLLRNIARGVDAGDVAYPGPLQEGHDETAELAVAFRAMLFRLRQYQENLEETVQIRTRELQETSRSLAEAMASAKLIVWSADTAPFALRYVSPNAAELLQLDPSPTCVSDQFHRRLTRRSKNDWLRAIKSIRTGANHEATVEIELTRPGVGVSQWLRCRMVDAGRDTGPNRIDGFMIDATMEVASVHHARLLSNAIHETQNGVVIVDVSGGDERNVFANQAFTRITGYRQEEILGKSCNLLQGSGTSTSEVARIRDAVRQGASCESLLLNYKKDGTPFWNELRLSPIRDDRGRVMHYVGVQVDVTQRVEMDTQLRSRTAYLDTILRLSPDGFLAFDAAGKLRYINPAFWRLTGLEEYESISEGFLGLMNRLRAKEDPKRSGCVDAALELAMQNSAAKARQSVYTKIFLQRPESATLSVHAWYVENEGAVVCLRDITRAMELERLKSQFLSTAAHELRTPLASVLGFTELILERDLGEERSRELLHIVLRQANLLRRLVDELLDLARIEARGATDFTFTPCSLHDVLMRATREFVSPKESHLLSVQLSETPLPVRVDEARVVRAIGNLISNAVKYWPDGGTIHLHAYWTVRDNRQYGAITVSDQGIGMTPDQLARAFERFYRANDDGSIPGTGLGLPLVKEILEIHHGLVELKSTPGKGTDATLLLPIAQTGCASSTPSMAA